MKGLVSWGGVVVAIVCGLSSAASAAEVKVTDADRVFRNFTREAATVGDGVFRLELRGMTMEDNRNVSLDILGFPVREVEKEVDAKRGAGGSKVQTVRGGGFDLLGSYGLGSNTEIGFDVPYLFQTIRFRPSCEDTDGVCDPGRPSSAEVKAEKQKENPDQNLLRSAGLTGTRNEQDVGDVLLYGKFKRKVAEHCASAFGMELKLPTGIENKRLGTGEMGFQPFLSTRYQKGRVGIGAHVGYQIYTGDVRNEFNYSVHVVLRATEKYAVRTEISGRLFKADSRQFHDAVMLPGIDINLTDRIVIRPTGIANLTDEAIDWGLALGIAAQL